MVRHSFSVVIKFDSVFDLPETGLFIPVKVQLAKYMVCMTTFFQLCDHYFSRN